MICGIRWVSELIEIAGGEDVFRNRANGKLARERQITVEDVAAAAPEMMIACWCGKPLDRPSVLGRPGMAEVPAIRDGRLFEVAPELILQPGPACITDGLDALVALIREFPQTG
jgi:iron complex transport system substrate-binding protein